MRLDFDTVVRVSRRGHDAGVPASMSDKILVWEAMLVTYEQNCWMALTVFPPPLRAPQSAWLAARTAVNIEARARCFMFY